MASARIDPARVQRATQGPSQSTRGGRNHVVERSGVRLERPGRGLVVLRDLVVYPEKNVGRLGRHKRLSQRALDSLDANLRNVGDLAHVPSLLDLSLPRVRGRVGWGRVGWGLYVGRLNQNRVTPACDSAPTRPPVPSTNCLTMARPMPA